MINKEIYSWVGIEPTNQRINRTEQGEDKEVELHAVRRRTQQLSDKFSAAAREDDATREHLRNAMLDRVARS